MIRYITQFNTECLYDFTYLYHVYDYGLVRVDKECPITDFNKYSSWNRLTESFEGDLLPFKLELIYES